jgi:hypothetical protein
MRIESIEHMNDQWIGLNEGGLLPAQNAVTALVQLYILAVKQWDKNTLNNILNTGYEVYTRSVKYTKVIAKEKQQKNPPVSFQFVELGGFLGYNQIVSPISISNHNIEHKAEFKILSNSLSESFMTLSQGINSFFEKGGISGVILHGGYLHMSNIQNQFEYKRTSLWCFRFPSVFAK